jgi:uncharacterized protein
MSGEADLAQLLAGMEPVLDPVTYVFAVTTDPQHPLRSEALMTMTEGEGLTLILPEGLATPDLTPIFPCRRITLTVHSSLAAVGLTAACAGALTRAGISCNTVAGYYHDHFFVPVDRADDAMKALWALAGR